MMRWGLLECWRGSERLPSPGKARFCVCVCVCVCVLVEGFFVIYEVFLFFVPLGGWGDRRKDGGSGMCSKIKSWLLATGALIDDG